MQNKNIKLAWVNKNKCIGCGVCVDLCDEVFQLDPCGIADTMITSIENSNMSELEKATSQCPTHAISMQ